MYLWLDDMRPAPKWWVWAKTFHDAVRHLQAGYVEYASLDHDLGPGRSGYDLCLWMAEEGVWPDEGVRVHSQNTVGAKAMCQVVNRYGPYKSGACKWEPFKS